MSDQKLYNIGIVAHVDAGKTTITENILYLSGQIRSLGRVDQGTASTDWLDVEQKRGISVRAACRRLVWQNQLINLIDTPGHIDFTAEVERSLRVLDGAILVISAVEGIQSQTEVLWQALQELAIPTLIFINKIDRAGTNLARLLESIEQSLSPAAFPVQEVSGVETKTPRIVDIFSGATSDTIAAALERISEFLANNDETLIEAYLTNESIPLHLLTQKFSTLARAGAAYPVFFGCALQGAGISLLLDGVIQYLPAATQTNADPVSAVIFKIEHHKTLGRLAYIRLYGGELYNRDQVYNTSQAVMEKIAQIKRGQGNRFEDVGYLAAGDIGAVVGLRNAKIGDLLGDTTRIPKAYSLAAPLLTVEILPAETGEFTQVLAAMQQLSAEDPLLDLQWSGTDQKLYVKLVGLMQLEILTTMLTTRFGLTVSYSPPTVIYQETPTKSGEGYVSYTMPKPCWAKLRFQIEPLPLGTGVSYHSIVSEDVIPRRYQNQVAEAIPQALTQGLYGWEVRDLKITLIDGEYHIEHTHSPDFTVATPMALMDGLRNTKTTLLEPMIQFKIIVPEALGGRILSDLVQMRAEFASPSVIHDKFSVSGTMPVATSLDYPVQLASITSGTGTISTKFDTYRPCPFEQGKSRERLGVNPLDRAKYILSVRNAI